MAQPHFEAAMAAQARYWPLYWQCEALLKEMHLHLQALLAQDPDPAHRLDWLRGNPLAPGVSFPAAVLDGLEAPSPTPSSGTR